MMTMTKVLLTRSLWYRGAGGYVNVVSRSPDRQCDKRPIAHARYILFRDRRVFTEKIRNA
jgi:hypothetical protein